MPRVPTHPLAEYPLDNLRGKPECSLPSWHRAYLHTVMLENSLRQCEPFVEGSLLDIGCGQRPYEKTFFARAKKYLGTDYLSDRSRPDVVCSANRGAYHRSDGAIVSGPTDRSRRGRRGAGFASGRPVSFL